MDFGRAFFAGVVGGGAMSIILLLARLTGITAWNVEMTMGSLATRVVSPLSWWIGFLMHLVISGLIACLYACGFEYITRRATWRIGTQFAIIHMFLAGLGTLALGAVHPLMTPSLASAPDNYLLAPGLGAINFGVATFIVFILLHLLYGSVVGAMYKTVRLRAARIEAWRTRAR
jgi:hypothetical protein